MKKYYGLLISAFLIISLIGCEENNKDIVITGTGDIISQTVDAPSFNSIKLVGVANIYISIGDTQKVVLKAQQEILDVMTYEVSNEELTLSFEEDVSINTLKEIAVEIIIPEIDKITLIGTGNFELSGEKQDGLIIELIGTGNVKAYNLELDTCTITISGVGNCEVRVNNSLNVTITGVGYVHYKGNPTVQSNISGVGNVIDDN